VATTGSAVRQPPDLHAARIAASAMADVAEIIPFEDLTAVRMSDRQLATGRKRPYLAKILAADIRSTSDANAGWSARMRPCAPGIGTSDASSDLCWPLQHCKIPWRRTSTAWPIYPARPSARAVNDHVSGDAVGISARAFATPPFTSSSKRAWYAKARHPYPIRTYHPSRDTAVDRNLSAFASFLRRVWEERSLFATRAMVGEAFPRIRGTFSLLRAEAETPRLQDPEADSLPADLLDDREDAMARYWPMGVGADLPWNADDAI